LQLSDYVLSSLVILESGFARQLKEKEEQFSSTVEELKGKLYDSESRSKGMTFAQRTTRMSMVGC
jgi:hypothetical protein